MRKRIKLFVTIAALCFSLATLVFAVYASMANSFNTNGVVNYIVEDVFVDIETKVYSTSKRYSSDQELKTQATGFEVSGFETLDTMQKLDETQNFDKVQIKNLDKGEDYTVLDTDYVDTYSSVTLVDPQPLDLSLRYSSSEFVFTYFVVIKVTNKSDHPLYAYVPMLTGDYLYKAPGNSYNYRPTKAKEIPTRDSSVYMIFAMSIKDLYQNLTDEEFKFPVAITINKETVEDENQVIKQGAHITERNVVSVTESSTTVEVTSEEKTISTKIQSYTDEFGFVMLNFDATEVPENSDIQFTALMYADFGGSPLIPQEHEITSIELVEGKYKTFEEVYANMDSIVPIADATKVRNGDGSYSITIPRSHLSDGKMEFTFGVICPVDLVQTLETFNITQLNITMTTNSKLTYEQASKEIEWEEGNVASVGMPFETTKTATVETTISAGDEITKAFTFQNYTLNKIPEDKTAIDMNITSQFAEYAYVFEGTIDNVTIETIWGVIAAESFSVLAGFNQGYAEVNIPLKLDQNGFMEFYIIFLYDVANVENAQEVTLSTTIEYSTPREDDVSYFNFELDYNYPYFEQGYAIVGLKDNTLTSITIPSFYNGIPVNVIEYSAFSYNNNLETVDFEENSQIKTIRSSAFSNCANLKTVNLHKCTKLRTIEYNAFGNCTSLTTMSLPDSVISLERGSFPTSGAWCNNNIINGKYTSNTGRVYALSSNNATSFDFNGVHVIAENFATSNLATVTNLNSVKVICDNAFANAVITSIALPSTLENVGEGIFSNCDSLTTITVDYSNPKYSDGGINAIIDKTTQKIVAGCKNTNLANVSTTAIEISRQAFEDITFSGATTIGGNIEKIDGMAFYSCTIPNLIIGDGVVKLEENAFDWSEISSLSIGSGLKNSNSGFYRIKNLGTITISEENTYYKVDKNCLIEISSNKLIKGTNNSIIPGYVTEVGDYAFYSCKLLTAINLPEGITRIGEHAFYDCDGLTSVVLPNGLTTMGYYAFVHCDALAKVVIPGSLTNIENQIFDYCYNIETIEFLEGFKAVGEDMFYNNSSGLTKLKTIIIREPSVIDLSQNNFLCSSITAIYVPDASVETYKSATNWSTYAGVIKPLSEYVPPTA